MAKNKGAEQDLKIDRRRIVLSMRIGELHIPPRYRNVLSRHFETVGDMITYLKSRDDGYYSGLYQIYGVGECAAVETLLELFDLGVLKSKHLRSIPPEVLDRYRTSQSINN